MPIVVGPSRANLEMSCYRFGGSFIVLSTIESVNHIAFNELAEVVKELTDIAGGS
jgi:hypothetical protein